MCLNHNDFLLHAWENVEAVETTGGSAAISVSPSSAFQSYPVSSRCFFRAVCLKCSYSTQAGLSITDIPDLGDLSLFTLACLQLTTRTHF